ncbi:MAG TPA: NADH-quinone oxidoreductase subunit N [Marinilabiliales bacterium]|nr:NADH-quinone oxidoreductase subunit N [Marinilabiliales bacterium]
MSALIITIVLGIIVLYLGFLKKKAILAPAAIAGLLIVLYLSFKDWGLGSRYFHDMILFDNFSIAFNISMIIITILIFLFGIDYYQMMSFHVAEQYALMIFALVGAFLMTSFSNLIMLFMGIEILSIPLYVLAGGKKASFRSNEASFKYFMLGSFATAIFLFGIALVYGASATFYLPEIKTFIAQFNGHLPPMVMVGLLFIIIGVAFKVAVAPFHFWSPDVYEGSPTLVTAFMATVVKTAGFAAFYRLLGMGLLPLPGPLEKALWVMTGLTLLVGNLGALKQTNFKRLLAYSAIAHSGFIMLAMLSQHDSSAKVLLYYTFVYSLATVPLFIIFILVKRASIGQEELFNFRGLFKEKPWIAVFMTILLVSLVGIPPTSGFMAKYQVFVLSISQGNLLISIFAILMAVIGIYYYFFVVREIYTESEQLNPIVVTKLNGALIVVCSVAVGLLGIFVWNLPI